MSPFYGKLGDMYGRKNVSLFAIALFLLGSLLCGLAWSMPALIGARILQGLGGGGLMVSAFAIIGELFEPRERAKYQGYSSACFTLASVLGPVGGGYLTDLTGWRSVFLINLPIAIAVLAIDRTGHAPQVQDRPARDGLSRRHAAGHRHRRRRLLEQRLFDTAGTSCGSTWRCPSSHVAVIAGFVLVERRAAEPIVPLRLFANRTISLVTIISVLLGIGTLGMYFYFALYMQMITRTFAGRRWALLLTPMPIAVSVVSILAGRAVARTAATNGCRSPAWRSAP